MDLEIHRLALLDLDGVIFDERHRTHFALDRNWMRYFSLAHLDGVFPQGRHLYERHVEAGFHIAYLTTRREDMRKVTEERLAHFGFATGPLIMRPFADQRPAATVKASIVRDIADSGAWDDVCLYDDDPNIIQEVKRLVGCEAGSLCTWYRKPPRLAARSAVWSGAGRSQ